MMPDNAKAAFRAAAPHMDHVGLLALYGALLADDPRLIQGVTTDPPNLMSRPNAPCEGACLIGYTGLRAGLTTCAEVEEYFGAVMKAAQASLAEPGGMRWLTNWYDETDRETMRAALLPEVRAAIAAREGGAA